MSIRRGIYDVSLVFDRRIDVPPIGRIQRIKRNNIAIIHGIKPVANAAGMRSWSERVFYCCHSKRAAERNKKRYLPVLRRPVATEKIIGDYCSKRMRDDNCRSGGDCISYASLDTITNSRIFEILINVPSKHRYTAAASKRDVLINCLENCAHPSPVQRPFPNECWVTGNRRNLSVSEACLFADLAHDGCCKGALLLVGVVSLYDYFSYLIGGKSIDQINERVSKVREVDSALSDRKA
jgi:hypothetical protein